MDTSFQDHLHRGAEPLGATTPRPGQLQAADVKASAAGRWPEIFTALGGIDSAILDGRNHPCPQCGGKDRFRAIDIDAGALFCNQCFSEKNGDGLAALQWLNGWTFPEAIRAVAAHLGMAPANGKPAPSIDLIEKVCRDKRMPRTAFEQFEPEVATRGRTKNGVVRVPVYNERGEKHSHFDFAPGCKGWFAKGKGMAGVFFPVKLPQPGETWLIVEGCKDAAALIGLGFNACGLPTSSMADKYARLFSGVDIVIVHDLDSAGQLGAQKTGGRLEGIAASVRVARLPGEIVESGGDDVRDVLKRTDGERLVREAVDTAEPWERREGEVNPKDGRPEVLLTLNYGFVSDQVTRHLGRLGWESPWIPTAKQERLKLYQRGGMLVHVIDEADGAEVGGVNVPAGTARIRTLPAGQLPIRIADACQLMQERQTEDGITLAPTSPPKWLIEGVHSRGDYGADVRRLEGIIVSPTLRPDGTILQSAGYDPRTGLLYRPNSTFPKIADKPTRADAKTTAAELLEVVADFPFVDDADRSAWLAMTLSFLSRTSVAGCVPLFGFTSTCRGSGKSLGVDAASLIAFGKPAARKTFTPDDNEMRKSITAVAIEAVQSVLLDNVSTTLGGASLDAAITAETWSDRLLGASKTTGEIPLRTVWTATGNNLRYGSDLARRVLPIRLAPQVENPEERSDFQHADLLGWVRSNRPRLAVAALTILRAYFEAGKPKQTGGTWGSFESWTATIRGAIVWAGLADPLTTRETAKEDDLSGAVVRGLIGGLLEVDESCQGMTVRQIVDVLNDGMNGGRFPTMREVVGEVATVRGQIDARKLGYVFRKHKGRIANGWKIQGESSHGGVIRWNARKVNGGDGCYVGDAPGGAPSESCVSHTHTW